MFETLTVKTSRRAEMIDITDRIQDIVRGSSITDGCAICYVPHTTAGVTIQENADPDVVHDVLYKLENLVPHADPNFRHGEGNSDAHIKASLMGSSVTVPIRASALVLGTWQAIYFCEFDGPRSRSLHVKLIEG
jgi:secondary thiamine-phosphate synthase enzyme